MGRCTLENPTRVQRCELKPVDNVGGASIRWEYGVEDMLNSVF